MTGGRPWNRKGGDRRGDGTKHGDQSDEHENEQHEPGSQGDSDTPGSNQGGKKASKKLELPNRSEKAWRPSASLSEKERVLKTMKGFVSCRNHRLICKFLHIHPLFFPKPREPKKSCVVLFAAFPNCTIFIAHHCHLKPEFDIT
jgi:hypothetical protein